MGTIMILGFRQRGMTLLGFLMVLCVIGAIAFIGMRLFPVYSEYYSMVSDLKALQAEAGTSKLSPEMVKDRLFRRFYISYVTSVKNEHVTIDRNNGYNLTVAYEVRRPLMYNLDFVAMFEKTVDLSRSDGVD
jgi:hypothetical protein